MISKRLFLRLPHLWAIFLATFFLSAAAPNDLGPKDGAGLPVTEIERVKVGDKAPDFTLENMDGKRIPLSAYRGKKNVVLVFYRGYW